MKLTRTTLRAAMAGFVLVAFAFATPASAVQDDTRLGDLFKQLKTAPSEDLAEAVEEQIWSIWLDYPGREVQTLMNVGVKLLRKDDFKAALSAFDRIVAIAPDYAEGWNKRANAHYLMGDYPAAVGDIRRALMLEPRHFAALAGLGLVYMAVEEPSGALRAFEAALAINPYMDGVRDQVDKLRQQLAGSPL